MADGQVTRHFEGHFPRLHQQHKQAINPLSSFQPCRQPSFTSHRSHAQLRRSPFLATPTGKKPRLTPAIPSRWRLPLSTERSSLLAPKPVSLLRKFQCPRQGRILANPGFRVESQLVCRPRIPTPTFGEDARAEPATAEPAARPEASTRKQRRFLSLDEEALYTFRLT